MLLPSNEGEVMKTAASGPALEPAPVLLSTSDPDLVAGEIQQVQLAMTRRAYELFQIRGGQHGRDWEDWFRAESELLRPVSIAIGVSLDRVSVRANVLGFSPADLKIAIEPQTLLLIGKRASESKKRAKFDAYPDQIMKRIDLPASVLPEAAVVELQAGVLKFELPRSAPLGAASPGV
jgi:HSP20 family protein